MPQPGVRALVGGHEGRRIDLQPPADEVLDRLRRVRLGEERPKKNRGSPRTRRSSSTGCTSPTPRSLHPLVERDGRALGMHRGDGDGRAETDHAGTRPGCRGALDAHTAPIGESGEHRLLDPGRRAPRACRPRTPGAVRARHRGPIRQAAPTPVERDHPMVPGEVGHLELPVTRVDDRPRRQSTMVGSPSPNSSQWSLTPSRST